MDQTISSLTFDNEKTKQIFVSLKLNDDEKSIFNNCDIIKTDTSGLICGVKRNLITIHIQYHPDNFNIIWKNEKEFYDNNKIKKRIETEYDNQNIKKKTETEFDDNGKIKKTTETEYDNQDIKKKIETEFDDNGKIKKIISINYIKNTKMEYTRNYDKYPNKPTLQTYKVYAIATDGEYKEDDGKYRIGTFNESGECIVKDNKGIPVRYNTDTNNNIGFADMHNNGTKLITDKRNRELCNAINMNYSKKIVKLHNEIIHIDESLNIVDKKRIDEAINSQLKDNEVLLLTFTDHQVCIAKIGGKLFSVGMFSDKYRAIQDVYDTLLKQSSRNGPCANLSGMMAFFASKSISERNGENQETAADDFSKAINKFANEYQNETLYDWYAHESLAVRHCIPLPDFAKQKIEALEEYNKLSPKDKKNTEQPKEIIDLLLKNHRILSEGRSKRNNHGFLGNVSITTNNGKTELLPIELAIQYLFPYISHDDKKQFWDMYERRGENLNNRQEKTEFMTSSYNNPTENKDIKNNNGNNQNTEDSFSTVEVVPKSYNFQRNKSCSAPDLTNLENQESFFRKNENIKSHKYVKKEYLEESDVEEVDLEVSDGEYLEVSDVEEVDLEVSDEEEVGLQGQSKTATNTNNRFYIRGNTHSM